MPIMDGLSATKRIREMIRDKILDNIPIVACSAYVYKHDID